MLALILLACASTPERALGMTSAASASGVWLRSSFDADATPYVGRFVPTGARALDESAAMPLACSRFITSRFVQGGGVKLTESFQASSEVGARLGVPLLASGSASAQSSQNVRVSYTLTGKLVAEIADPAGFAACCKSAPDQCTDRFVGEFLQGTGAVLSESTQSVGVGASGTHPGTGLGGEGSLAQGSAASRVVEFPNPVYFAFKVTRTPYTAQASSCPDWVRSPPRLKDGVSLVGRSKESKNESSARSGALADAQKQLWQMTGADLSEGSGIEPREWCVETRTSEEGDVRYVGNVLVAVSGASLEALKSQGGAPGVTPAPAAATTPEPAGGGAPGGVLARANALPGVTLPGKKESREVATAGPRPVLPALAGREVPSAEAPGGAPLTDADVAPIVQALNKQPYSKDKLVVLRDRVSGRPLTAMQAATLLRCFANGFPDVQFEALVVLAPAITDRANAQLVVETFWMGVYAAKAEQLLKQGPHPNASPAHRAP